MSSRPFRILLFTGDRALLRHASRLLSVFGYQVDAVASLGQASALLQAESPDILLLDGATDIQQAQELCRQAGESARAGYMYKLMIAKEMTPADAVRWLEAGVDDFLGAPLEHGELLARLRTGVRVLEFERRLARPGGQGKLRLQSRLPFVSRLESEMTRGGTTRPPIACMVVEVDQGRALAALHGREASEDIVARVAKLLGSRKGEVPAVAQLDEYRFAAVFRGPAENAAAFADSLREQLRASDFSVRDKRFQPTLSCGISDSTSKATTADELLRQAEGSLAQAQESGGDFVARYGQFAEEDQQWVELAQNGALFERTLARDIMVPCTLVVRKEDTLAEASALFEQTQLQALPVVDEEGKLAGLLTASTVRMRLSADEASNKPASSAMTSDVASFDERTTLDALIDYFTQESPLAIAIVHKGRPTGLVTPSSLATLSEQLTTESFSDTGSRRGRAALIVANFCAMDT
jgi:DNA-binding response OmpR family regulator/CBS domain-containing protein